MSGSASLRLVVFGCGYVGTAVARLAVAAGMRVSALTRNAARAEQLRAEGIDTVVSDLASTAWHGEVQGAPDFVLNAVSSGGGGLEGYRHSYVEGMRSIAAWAGSRGPVGTLVYTSSTAVYPQGGGVEVDEKASTEGADERPAILLEAESLVRSGGGGGAWRRWFVLRLAGIYGPGRRHLIEQVKIGEVSGRPEQHLNLVHRDDIAAAILACFRAPAAIGNEIFNVADDGRATRGEIVGWLATRLGMLEPRFTSEPAGTRRRLTPDRVIANGWIKERLGWRPKFATFREGYADVLAE